VEGMRGWGDGEMGGWGDGGMRKNNNRLFASFTPSSPYLPTSLPPHLPTLPK